MSFFLDGSPYTGRKTRGSIPLILRLFPGFIQKVANISTWIIFFRPATTTGTRKTGRRTPTTVKPAPLDSPPRPTLTSTARCARIFLAARSAAKSLPPQRRWKNMSGGFTQKRPRSSSATSVKSLTHYLVLFAITRTANMKKPPWNVQTARKWLIQSHSLITSGLSTVISRINVRFVVKTSRSLMIWRDTQTPCTLRLKTLNVLAVAKRSGKNQTSSRTQGIYTRELNILVTNVNLKLILSAVYPTTQKWFTGKFIAFLVNTAPLGSWADQVSKVTWDPSIQTSYLLSSKSSTRTTRTSARSATRGSLQKRRGTYTGPGSTGTWESREFS